MGGTFGSALTTTEMASDLLNVSRYPLLPSTAVFEPITPLTLIAPVAYDEELADRRRELLAGGLLPVFDPGLFPLADVSHSLPGARNFFDVVSFI